MAGETVGKSAERIEQALIEARGVIAHAARRLGMTRAGLWKRVQKSARLQQIVQSARDELVDDLEFVALNKALEGDASMLQFLLRNLGRHRGYGETLSVTHQGELQHNLRLADYRRWAEARRRLEVELADQPEALRRALEVLLDAANG